MAASTSLRSKFAVINRSLFFQKCALCTHKKLCTTASDGQSDLVLDKTHKRQRLGYWVPLDELGVKVHPEEKEKLDAYFTRNKDNKKYDVFQSVPQQTIASNSTILVKGNGKTPIAVPKKKKRDSLSVLKALASTIGTDPTAPHYSFIDDPYLIPSKKQQEACLLAKASGKRAARYFINKHSALFGHDDASPHVPAFQPQDLSYKFNDVCEEALMERIDRRAVSHAIEVYDRMMEQGLQVSAAGTARLLELLCAYQCQDPVHDIFPEERLAQANKATGRKPMDKAMEVFDGIATRTADTYNWIIRSLAHAGDSRCWTLFEEMQVEEFTADLGTFNDLLNLMGREASTNRMFGQVKNLLKKMTAAGVQPDLDTPSKHCATRYHEKEPPDRGSCFFHGSEFEDQDDEWDKIKPLYDVIWNTLMKHTGSHDLKFIEKKKEVTLSTEHFKVKLDLKRKKNKKKAVRKNCSSNRKQTFAYPVQETLSGTAEYSQYFDGVASPADGKSYGNTRSHFESDRLGVSEENWQFPQLTSHISEEETAKCARKDKARTSISQSDLGIKTILNFRDPICDTNQEIDTDDTDPYKQKTSVKDFSGNEKYSHEEHADGDMSVKTKENGEFINQTLEVKKTSQDTLRSCKTNDSTIQHHIENIYSHTIPESRNVQSSRSTLHYEEQMKSVQLHENTAAVQQIEDSIYDNSLLENEQAPEETYPLSPNLNSSVFISLYVYSVCGLQDPDVYKDETLCKGLVAETANTNETTRHLSHRATLFSQASGYPNATISDRSLDSYCTSDISSDITSENADEHLLLFHVLAPASIGTPTTQVSSGRQKGKTLGEETWHSEPKSVISLAGLENMLSSNSVLVYKESWYLLHIQCIAKALLDLRIRKENGTENTLVHPAGSFIGLTLILTEFMLAQIEYWLLNCHENLHLQMLILIIQTAELSFPVIYIVSANMNMFRKLACLSKQYLQLEMPEYVQEAAQPWHLFHLFRQKLHKRVKIVQTTKLQSIHLAWNISERNINVMLQHSYSYEPVSAHHMLTVQRNTGYLQMPPSLLNYSEDCQLNRAVQTTEVGQVQTMEVGQVQTTEVEQVQTMEGGQVQTTDIRQVQTTAVEQTTEVGQIQTTEFGQVQTTVVGQVQTTEVQTMVVGQVETIEVEKVQTMEGGQVQTIEVGQIQTIEVGQVQTSEVEEVQAIEVEVVQTTEVEYFQEASHSWSLILLFKLKLPEIARIVQIPELEQVQVKSVQIARNISERNIDVLLQNTYLTLYEPVSVHHMLKMPRNMGYLQMPRTLSGLTICELTRFVFPPLLSHITVIHVSVNCQLSRTVDLLEDCESMSIKKYIGFGTITECVLCNGPVELGLADSFKKYGFRLGSIHFVKQYFTEQLVDPEVAIPEIVHQCIKQTLQHEHVMALVNLDHFRSLTKHYDNASISLPMIHNKSLAFEVLKCVVIKTYAIKMQHCRVIKMMAEDSEQKLSTTGMVVSDLTWKTPAKYNIVKLLVDYCDTYRYLSRLDLSELASCALHSNELFNNTVHEMDTPLKLINVKARLASCQLEIFLELCGSLQHCFGQLPGDGPNQTSCDNRLQMKQTVKECHSYVLTEDGQSTSSYHSGFSSLNTGCYVTNGVSLETTSDDEDRMSLETSSDEGKVLLEPTIDVNQAFLETTSDDEDRISLETTSDDDQAFLETTISDETNSKGTYVNQDWFVADTTSINNNEMKLMCIETSENYTPYSVFCDDFKTNFVERCCIVSIEIPTNVICVESCTQTNIDQDRLLTIHNVKSIKQCHCPQNHVQDSALVCGCDNMKTDQAQGKDKLKEFRIGHTLTFEEHEKSLLEHDTKDDAEVCCHENKEVFSSDTPSPYLWRKSLSQKKTFLIQKIKARKRQVKGRLLQTPHCEYISCCVHSSESSSFDSSGDYHAQKWHKTVKQKSDRDSKKWYRRVWNNSDRDVKKGHKTVMHNSDKSVKKRTLERHKTRLPKCYGTGKGRSIKEAARRRTSDKLSQQSLIRQELQSDDSGIMTQTTTDTDSWLSWRTIVREYCERTQQHQIAKDVAQRLYVDHAYQLQGTVAVYGLRSFFNRVNTGEPLTQEEEMQFEWLRFITFSVYEGEGNGIALARNGFYHCPELGPTATRCFACDLMYEDWTLLENVEVIHRRLSPNCPLLHNNSGQGTRRNISIAADDGPQRAASSANVNVRDASATGTAQSAGATSNTHPPQSVSIFPHGRSPANFNHPATPETIRQFDAAAAARRNTSPASTSHTAVSPLTERLGNAQINELEEGPRSILAQPTEDPENREARSHRTGYNDQDRSVSGIRPSDMFGGGPVGHGAFAASLPVTTRQPQEPLRSSSAPLTNLPLTTETVTRSSSSATIAGPSQTTTPPQQTAVIQPRETEPRRENVTLQRRSSTPLKTVPAALERPSHPRGPEDPSLNVDLTTGIYIERPRHPEYNTLQARIITFTDWPAHLDQDTRQLAELGFFHVGVADFVRCFACGGGLRNWERGDNPLVEHIRWFPNCEYMRKLKGQAIIDLVLRHVREQEAAEGAAGSRTSDLNTTDPLQTSVAQQLIDMGFPENRVKDGIIGARQRHGREDVTANEVIEWMEANPTEAAETKTPVRMVVRQSERPVQAGPSTTTTTTTGSSSSTTLTTSQGQVNVEVTVSGNNIASTTTTATVTAGGANDDDDEYETPPEGNTSAQTKSGGKKKKKKKTKGGTATSESANEGAAGGQTEAHDPVAIQRENERLRDMQTCKICMERPVDTTLLPCGHLVTCNICAQRLAKCPICRKKKEGAVKTFMS